MRLERLQPEGPHGAIRVRAPAKVNLRLEILDERPDGYHDIDSIFLAVSLYDTLELREAPGEDLDLEVTAAPGEAGAPAAFPVPEAEGNLVARAARLVRRRAEAAGRPAPASWGLVARLHKGIPMGAGLGGGSSDAAATLLALDELWRLRLPGAALAELAAELGSDVPFFLHGGLARCRGRGERVDAIVTDGPPPAFHLVLACPPIAVPTPLVYKKLKALRREGRLLTSPEPLHTMNPESIVDGIAGGRLLFNRLQEVALSLFPELEQLHDVLAEEPFVRVLMSGSGSAFFGLCRGRREAEEIAGRVCRRLLRERVLLGGAAHRVLVRTVEGLPGWSLIGDRSG